MTKVLLPATLLLVLAISTVSLPAQTPTNDAAMKMISSVMATAEILHGQVLKVYNAEDKGALYIAYVVDYKGTEVVIPDMMHAGVLKKVGDPITYMTQRLDLPGMNGKTPVLQFVVMP